MKRMLLPLAYLLLLASIANSQSITITEESPEVCSNAGTNTLDSPISDGGTPARNSYTGVWNSGLGTSVIKWVEANSRWEVQVDDGLSVYILWVSTFASYPNPPDLATGNWVDAGENFCNVLTELSGSGTQTLVLPVELVRFNGKEVGKDMVQLDWQTASEQNNQGFHIERSTENDGRWTEIGFVAGNGTSTEMHDYVFQDKTPLPGTNYYRLRQTDFDGQENYSDIISLEMGHERSLHISPNPASGEVTLQLNTEYYGEATLYFFDAMGRMLHTQVLFLEGRAMKSKIDLTKLPNSGLYLLVVEAGQYRWQQKISVE